MVERVEVGYSLATFGPVLTGSVVKAVNWLKTQGLEAMQGVPLVRAAGLAQRFPFVESGWTDVEGVPDHPGSYQFVRKPTVFDRYLFGTDPNRIQKWIDDQMQKGATIVVHHLDEAKRLVQKYGVGHVLLEMHEAVISHDELLNKDRLNRVIQWAESRWSEYHLSSLVWDTGHAQQYHKTGKPVLLLDDDHLIDDLSSSGYLAAVHLQCTRKTDQVRELLAGEEGCRPMQMLRRIRDNLPTGSQLWVVNETTLLHRGLKWVMLHCPLVLTAHGSAWSQFLMCQAIKKGLAA